MAFARPVRAKVTRILVVDDDPIIRTLCSAILSKAGYDVLTAQDSSEAMYLVASATDPIDLLVVDVFLPIPSELQLNPLQSLYPPLNGDEMVRHMLTIVDELRVVYISSSSFENLLKKGIDLGSDPFLQKPLNAEVFVQKVRETLEASPLRLNASKTGTRNTSHSKSASQDRAA